VNDKFYYSITPYVWFAGFDGQAGARNIATNVNNFGDVSGATRTGGGGYAEGRVKSYVMGLDASYFSVGNARTVTVVGIDNAFRLTFKQTVVQPSAGYTFGGDLWAVDLLAGIRYWSVGSDFDVDPLLIRVSNEGGGTRSWVDGVGGLRVNWVPFGVVRFILGGDGGGGGAKSTWQAYATLGLDVSSWCVVNLSYRGLGVNYDHHDFLYDVNTQGVTLAATFHFLSR